MADDASSDKGFQPDHSAAFFLLKIQSRTQPTPK